MLTVRHRPSGAPRFVAMTEAMATYEDELAVQTRSIKR
jgi:hypothetical protein